AEVLVEFSGPGEGSQLSRVSEKDRMRVNSTLVHRLLSVNTSRESAVERHLVASRREFRGRGKHCRNAGEEKRDQNPCCWFELNVSIFHDTENGKHVRTHGLSGKSADFLPDKSPIAVSGILDRATYP